MRRIFHLIARRDWEGQGPGPYHADSLATEGFIHCSNRDQVARVANLFYANQADLLLLCIDVDRLTSPLRDEDPGIGEQFPHVYGPIARDAITEVLAMPRDAKGEWCLPCDLEAPHTSR